MVLLYKKIKGISLYLSYSLIIGTGSFGCQSPKHFDNFDASAWKADRLGCEGKRQALRDRFEEIRPQLKGLTQEQILQTLGKPDFQKLYERNQKFYVYFLEPGLQCQGKSAASQASTAVLRFSAIELVTEVYFSTGRPQ